MGWSGIRSSNVDGDAGEAGGSGTLCGAAFAEARIRSIEGCWVFAELPVNCLWIVIGIVMVKKMMWIEADSVAVPAT